jgi:hypothetical protein
MKKLILFLFCLTFKSALSQTNIDIQYLFPEPGSKLLPKQTVLIVRFTDVIPDQIANLNSFIKIRGETSGVVEGNTIISTDGRTIIFEPNTNYTPGEKVFVNFTPKLLGNNLAKLDTTYEFIVSPKTQSPWFKKKKKEREKHAKANDEQLLQKSMGNDPIIIDGVSVPTDFPLVEITINDNPDPGYIFITNINYSIIFDNNGSPQWYWRIISEPLNLKVQPNGIMTVNIWEEIWDGPVGFDSTYTIVKHYHIPPGFWFDDHECTVLENGHYFVIFNDEHQIDMSQIVPGGDPNAWVLENNVAEMDANDNPIFIWRGLDHFNIADAIHEDLTQHYIDFCHMNTIEIDNDGHILISSRHLSEITKINRQTGDIIWRLGGVNNQFNWVNDSYQISYQHDIRVLPNGNYTLFDNGNYHQPQFSRALELDLDTQNMTATKVFEYRENPDNYAKWMGSTQRVPNGNTIINWAEPWLPKLTEVRPDGSKAFEMNFVEDHHAYRTHRSPWIGKAAVPYLIIEPYSDRITLIFNKFGDPDVDHYNVYGGLEPQPNQVMATALEPFIHLTELINGERYYFRVTAVNSLGQESGFSNEEEVLVPLTGVEDTQMIPVTFELKQNYPNPFNPSTTIRYTLPGAQFVTLIVYDILGREVATLVDERQTPGKKSVVWDGRNQFGKAVSSGVYVYQIRAGDYVKCRKMLLIQ